MTPDVHPSAQLSAESRSGRVDLNTFRLHNTARVHCTDPLTVESAPAQWSYAVDFAVTREENQPVDVLVDAEVAAGEAGIGLLTADESAFHVERLVAVEDGRATTKLHLAPGQISGRLVIRNVGATGGPAVVIIHAIDIESAVA